MEGIKYITDFENYTFKNFYEDAKKNNKSFYDIYTLATSSKIPKSNKLNYKRSVLLAPIDETKYYCNPDVLKLKRTDAFLLKLSFCESCAKITNPTFKRKARYYSVQTVEEAFSLFSIGTWNLIEQYITLPSMNDLNFLDFESTIEWLSTNLHNISGEVIDKVIDLSLRFYSNDDDNKCWDKKACIIFKHHNLLSNKYAKKAITKYLFDRYLTSECLSNRVKFKIPKQYICLFAESSPQVIIKAIDKGLISDVTTMVKIIINKNRYDDLEEILNRRPEIYQNIINVIRELIISNKTIPDQLPKIVAAINNKTIEERKALKDIFNDYKSLYDLAISNENFQAFECLMKHYRRDSDSSIGHFIELASHKLRFNSILKYLLQFFEEQLNKQDAV